MSAEKGSKHDTSKTQEARDRIALKVRDASDTVKKLVQSISMGIEEKIAIEDQINNLSREAESMLDRVEDVAKVNQKKLLLAYKKFLEHNLEAVNQRLKELE